MKVKINLIAFSLAVLTAGLLFKITPVSAAQTYLTISPAKMAVADTAIVSVFLNTEGASVNVVEGVVTISSDKAKYKIKELITASSALSLWPTPPSIADNGDITFVGGAPGGFNNNQALLFKIALTSEEMGSLSFDSSQLKVYSNDGQGSLLPLSSQILEVEVSARKEQMQDLWQEQVSADKTPPETLEAKYAQDETILDGQKYIFITASDSESGIDYFEVKEGSLPLVRSGQTYVLRDQQAGSEIIVIAYDKAGNVSKIMLTPPPATYNPYVMPIFALVIIGVLLLVVIILKRKKNQPNVKS